MSLPLMPKATAVWLIDNTSLSFEQVAQFCGLHPLEVQGIADGEVATGIQGMDPVLSGELTRDEIKRCEADPTARLAMAKRDRKSVVSGKSVSVRVDLGGRRIIEQKKTERD